MTTPFSHARTVLVRMLAVALLLVGAPATGQASDEGPPHCVPPGGGTGNVAYRAPGGVVTLDLGWEGEETIDVRFELDFGDGNAAVQRITDTSRWQVRHTYASEGQFAVWLAIRGTVDGVECANAPGLVQRVVVTSEPIDNLCIGNVSSERTNVRQLGEDAFYGISSRDAAADYTVTIEWQPFVETEIRVRGEGSFSTSHVYTFPGVYPTTLRVDGVDADGPCANPATVYGETVVERRLFGASRTETAVSISQASYPADGSAGGVVVARQDTFPDAVTGATAAAAVDGPLLLTPSDQLHPATEAELRRVLPVGMTVHLLGGTAALSDAVADRLVDIGYDVVRLAGSGREATSAAIAVSVVPDPTVVLLASGGTFPDAQLAGAAAARVGGAALLAGGAGLHPDVQAYLDAHPEVPLVAVGSAAAEVAPARAEEVVGADQFETAVRLAERFPSGGVGAGLASGEAFPDGLAGGAYLALKDHALLLTARDALPAVVEAHLRANGPMELMIFGGTAAISVDASGPAREASGNQ